MCLCLCLVSLASDLSLSASLAFRIKKCASKQPKNKLSGRNIVWCMSSTSFFSLCSCLFLCCSDLCHSPTYASACCWPCALAYPCFPTVPTCHVHPPLPALPLPVHAHMPSPACVCPYTPTPTHCCACPCLPAYAWVSSLYFFFFMLVLTASPHCLCHCLALAIPIPQWVMSACPMAIKCSLSHPWPCPPPMPVTWPTFLPLAMPAVRQSTNGEGVCNWCARQ